MGFLSGRVTFERFNVSGRDISLFDDKHLEVLDKYSIGKVGAITADGVEVGFTAGDHILDLDYRLEKNIINDAIHFGFRVDTNKIPGQLLKAYEKMELTILAADNPSGRPSRQQRQKAKELAQERCQEEAESGKFRRMKQFNVLWDSRQGILYFGGTSAGVIERFVGFFKEAFHRTLTRQTAGTLATSIANNANKSRAIEDLAPSVFTGAARKVSIAWVNSQFGSRDFLGNEFLLWLWWTLSAMGGTMKVSDDSTVAALLQKTLALECPLSETGKETITHETPIELPEAKYAIMNGKLPRKSGIVMVRHEVSYECVLQAESLAVSGAALPKSDADNEQAEKEERIDQIREFTSTLDLLYEAFILRRLSSSWSDDLKKMREWLKEDYE